MPSIDPLMNFKPSGILNLAHMAVIQAEGADAASFLQGQLTHDVLLLPVGQARLSGYCSPKGRLLASFVVLKISPEKFLMVCAQDLFATLVKRLSMFVMRAKVTLSDATSAYTLCGLAGDTLIRAFPSLQMQMPWSVLSGSPEDPSAFAIQLYPAGVSGFSVPRALWIAPRDQSVPASLSDAPALTQADWQLLEVLSGISMVQMATAEAFVPQMLNYESVNGVSFKKGCYPGQEVVARSQFRGTLKRRAYIVSCDSPMTVGQAVFSAEDPEQACGMVASAAAYGGSAAGLASSYWGIVSMQIAAAEQGLHLGNAQGPELHRHPLPYPLLEDI